MEEQTCNQVEDMVDNLKATSELSEEMKNSDPLKWAGVMNTIKNQAEEIVVKDLINI